MLKRRRVGPPAGSISRASLRGGPAPSERSSRIAIVRPPGEKAAARTTAAAGSGMRRALSAAVSGKKEFVELVLKGGFNVVEADNRGMSALVYASRGGSIDIVRLLLEKGVDPNILGKEPTPPLHLAATKEVAFRIAPRLNATAPIPISRLTSANAFCARANPQKPRRSSKSSSARTRSTTTATASWPMLKPSPN